jgi:uncharacterized RDD family membrane protein YckC
MPDFTDVRQAIAEEKLDQARDLLREHIKQEPDSAEVWYLAAQAAINEAQRRAFLEKAVEIDPLHAYAANELYDLLHPQSAVILSEPQVNVAENYDFDAPETTEVESDTPPYADIGQRFGAFMIDQILLMIAILPIVYYALIVLSTNESDTINQANALGAWSIIVSASVLLQAAYFGYFLSHRDGQTIGKKMMNVRVIKRDGSPLSLWEAILRSTIGYTFAILPFGFGFAWAALDKQRQAWQDMIADTIVVEA